MHTEQMNTEQGKWKWSPSGHLVNLVDLADLVNLFKNISYVGSFVLYDDMTKTSYSGDKWICYHAGRTTTMTTTNN